MYPQISLSTVSHRAQKPMKTAFIHEKKLPLIYIIMSGSQILWSTARGLTAWWGVGGITSD